MAGAPRKLSWAPQARRDLIDIWKYFAVAASPEVADGLLRDIKIAVDRLEDHPFLGRPRDEIAKGLRSLLVPPHSIIYRVTKTKVDIARIFHERRDIPAAFAEDRKP
jgi:toxin ParE1/3/4